MGWRYFANTLNGDGTESPLASDLPLTDVSITSTLSGADSIDATINPRDERLRTPEGELLLKDWSSAVYAEEDDDVRAGCILSHTEIVGPSLAMEFTGFGGYPVGMPYTASWSGTEIEVLAIVREIWRHLQAEPNGNLGVQVDATTMTGKKIGTELQQGEFDTESGPLSYQSGPFYLADYLAQDLGAEIDKLSEATPFDWRERHTKNLDGSMAHFIDFAYPRMGRRLEDLRFVLGENIFIVPTVVIDGDDYADTVLGLGNGEGRTMVRALQRKETGRLRRVKVKTDKSATDQRAINAVVSAELQWRALMDGDITELVLQDHKHAPVGSVSPGDEIFLQGRLDWRTIEMWFRVTAVTIRPSDPSAMTLSVTRSDRMSS